MARKSFNEKLHHSGDLPKIEDLSDRPEAVRRYGGTKMLIAPPTEYNEIMAIVPEGKLITADRIRSALAERAGADVTCPLTAGIFINICANASEERGEDKIPYWRTLKTGGELNPKYPGGIEKQREYLEAEGHRIEQRGKKCYVSDYENSLFEIGEYMRERE